MRSSALIDYRRANASPLLFTGHWLWAVRAGYYGLGADDNSAFTFGFGLSQPDPKHPFDAGIAVMTGDLDAMFGSLSFKF